MPVCVDFQKRRQNSSTTVHRALPVCELPALGIPWGTARSNGASAASSRCGRACTVCCGSRAGQLVWGVALLPNHFFRSFSPLLRYQRPWSRHIAKPRPHNTCCTQQRLCLILQYPRACPGLAIHTLVELCALLLPSAASSSGNLHKPTKQHPPTNHHLPSLATMGLEAMVVVIAN